MVLVGTLDPKHMAQQAGRLCRHSGLLHLGVALLELHVSLGAAAVATEADAREPPLHCILDSEKRSGGPQGELERGKDGGGTGGAAYGATAEEQLVQEHSEGDEASEVEQDVANLQSENGPRVVDCALGTALVSGGSICVPGSPLTLGHKLGGKLKVGDRQEREKWYEDKEVDLRGRARQGIDIIPVRDCFQNVSAKWYGTSSRDQARVHLLEVRTICA